VDIVAQVIPKAALAKCASCTLFNQPFVSTYGPEKADLVIVGEGPGREEVRNGRPFFPRENPPNAGWLLYESLRQLGVDQEKVMFTNVVLCWPEGNRDPSSDEIIACKERLLHEIKQREPKVIITLGNFATRTVLSNKLGVAALRTMDHSLFGARVVPTYHPAALFRMGGLFPDYAADLERAVKLLTGDLSLKRPNVQFVIIDSKAKLVQLLRIVESPISIDIETDALHKQTGNILCNGIAWISSKDGICRAAVIAEEQVYDPECIAILNPWLRKQHQIYHNAPFDAGFLWAKGNDGARIDDDTMLMAYALDERRGSHGLEPLAKTYFDAPNWKQIMLDPYIKNKKTSYRDVPQREVLYPYNAFDTYYTRILYDVMWKEMDEPLRRLYKNLMVPAANALLRMEMRGIRIDKGYAEVLHREYDEKQEVVLAILRKESGDKDFNPNSPKQVQELMAKRGFNLRSTKKEIMEELPDPIAKKIVESRHIRKMVSTYIEGFVEWADENSRVHPEYKQHDTVTGRLSAQDPPIQTVPRAPTERRLFVAPKGRVLVYADYNMHEYRAVAYLSGDPWLKQVFMDGRDLHTEMVEEYFKRVRLPEGMDGRTAAKMVNFGLLFGRGAWSLSVQLDMSEQEAQALIDRYFERMPLVRAFMKRQENTALTEGMIETVFGRRRRFGLVTRDSVHEVIKQAFNYPVQSTASDIALTALIQIDKQIDPRIAFPVTILHDGILVEVDTAHADEVAKWVTSIMLQAPKDTLPNLDFEWRVDTKVGDSWGSLTK
jgi:uracil-DNA glycosylase family 4